AVQKMKEQGSTARFQILGAIDEQHKRGIPEKTIRNWIEDGTIEYLGTTQDVRPFIEQADCIVLPSYREGTPRTLLEAASSGTPIIATDVPGCNHVVKHEFNGLLCRIKDETDLAEKMARMSVLNDEELREVGKNGRAKIENEFDESLVINKYLAALSNFRKAS